MWHGVGQQRAGTACSLGLVHGRADFSTSVRRKASEEANNNPVCLQGRVVPPLFSVSEMLVAPAWDTRASALGTAERRNNFGSPGFRKSTGRAFAAANIVVWRSGPENVLSHKKYVGPKRILKRSTATVVRDHSELCAQCSACCFQVRTW